MLKKRPHIYCPRTQKLETLWKLAIRDWGFLLEPGQIKHTRGSWIPDVPRYAIESGAYRTWQKGIPFDEKGYRFWIRNTGHAADWIALPDVVGDRCKTLELACQWYPRVRAMQPHTTILLVVQDGMDESDIVDFLRAGVGVFIGGSTEWKLKTMPYWGRVCARHGVWLHVGRVNTLKRLRMSAAAGATSIDGSGFIKFPDAVFARFDRWLDDLYGPAECRVHRH